VTYGILNAEVTCSVAYIRENFGWLPEGIKRLETRGLAVEESVDMMKNAGEKERPTCRRC
jgi:hypothetical protein